MNRLLSWSRRIRADDSGATALEFAIVASVFVIVSMGVIEFGRSLQVRNEMAYAMDWGARMVMMDEDASEDAIREEIKARFTSYNSGELDIDAPSAEIVCKTGGTMAARAVTISYPLDIFIPGFAGTLHMKLERTVPRGTKGCAV